MTKIFDDVIDSDKPCLSNGLKSGNKPMIEDAKKLDKFKNNMAASEELSKETSIDKVSLPDGKEKLSTETPVINGSSSPHAVNGNDSDSQSSKSSTTDEMTKSKSSATDEKTKNKSSTTNEKTKSESSTTDDKTKSKSSATDEKTKSKSSTTNEKTKSKFSTTNEKTKSESSTTDEKTKTESSADEKTKSKSSTTDEKTKNESSTTDEKTKSESSTTDEKTKSESSTDEKTKSKSSTTDEKTKSESSTDEKTKSKSSTTDEKTKSKYETSVKENLEKSKSKDDVEKSVEKLSSGKTPNSKIPDKISNSKDVTTAKSSSETSSIISSMSEKVTEKTSIPDKSPSIIPKENPLENGEDSSKEASRPDTPLSHVSSDLDLEESLLKDDITLPTDDQDDFCEEKLLQGIDEEILLKDKNAENDDASSTKSTSVSDKIKSREAENEKSSDTDRQDKEIEKILKNLNNSIGNNEKSNSSASGKTVKTTVESSASSSNSSRAKSDAKISDDSSAGAGSNSSLQGSSDSKTSGKKSDKLSEDSSFGAGSNSSLRGTSNSKTSGKRSHPDDKAGNSYSSASKLLKMDDKENQQHADDPEESLEKVEKSKVTPEESKDKTDTSTKSAPKKNAITFSEALKSIAMESKRDQLLPLDKPQPLIPVTEISSNDLAPSENLTVLGSINTQTETVESNKSPPPAAAAAAAASAAPSAAAPSSVVVDLETESQGKKRPLVEDKTSTLSLKPDLKKIRVFRNETANKKNDVDEITKTMEMTKTMASRLQEEKALQESKKSDEDKTLEKEGLICIDQEDLERKTVNELRKANLSNNKLKRIKRKDLESLVIELFVDKVLYEHQLGQQKDLCKRLEATLESNRKKAAQFHKEIEDLKKVTQRLQAEHLSRKGQVIAPVKVKRSVGIQATPTIIGKGIMHASSYGNIRVLSPTSNSTTSVITSISSNTSSGKGITAGNQVSVTNPSSNTNTIISTQTKSSTISIATKTVQIPKNDPKLPNSVTTVSRQLTSVNDMKVLPPGSVVSSQPLSFTNTQTGAGTQMVVVNPVVVQQPQNGVGSQILPVGPTTRVLRTPLTTISSTNLTSSTQFTASTLQSTVVQGGSSSSSSSSSSSTLIDLTDDDEASKTQRTTLQPGSLVAIQRTSGININQSTPGQFVTLNPPTSVGQLVLVPTTTGQATTALVVGSVANSTQSISTGVVRSTALSQSSVRFSSSNIVNTTRVVVGATQVNGSNFVAHLPRHPAPLPRAPPQQTSGYSKKLPPVPILKLSHKDNSIVLSWNMAKTDEHERVASYQLYAYQEGTAPPTPALWKKVGSVKALELPMACTLTQFMPGHVYHFAVRAVDIRSRLGPFSEPRSIRLGK